MDVVRNLEKAREVITPPEKWCVGSRHSSAGAHCALGAIEVAAQTGRYHADNCTPPVVALAAAIPADEREAIKAARLKDGRNGHVPGVNDNTYLVAVYNNTSDHKTVLEWFDRAIQLQREHPMEKA